MRILKSLIPALAISALILGCSKEGTPGPVGPTGATGPTGPAGSSIITVDSFYVSSSDWVVVSTNHYQYIFTTTNLSQSAIDNGIIQVTSLYPPSTWQAWPFYSGSNGGSYHYAYSLNSLILLVDNVTPPATSFKLKVTQ